MRIAVDGILIQNGQILLIKRAGKTFHNFLALPGGIVEEGEKVEETLQREMEEELAIKIKPLEILGVYSKKDRDPREHTISIVFICEFSGKPVAADDAKSFKAFDVEDALKLTLAFDHKQIITDFKKWLSSKGTYW